MVEKSFRCLAFFSPLPAVAREPKAPLLTRGPFVGKRPPEIVALHGTTGALLENMIRGVSQGFSRRLVLKGVGYRARLSERGLELSVGYSHPVCVYPPLDLDVVLESPTAFTVRGLRKDRVADFAARVRSVRPPEPYKGKGIAYEGEVIRRKAGKSGKPGR
jgi:large subunit ribosomal protein L6